MTVTSETTKRKQKHMAKQTKSAVAPAAAPVTNKTAAQIADGTVAAPAAKKEVKIREANGKDVLKRVFGPDGKGVALTTKNAKEEVVPWTTTQVKVICNLLEAAGEAGMTRKDLCDKLPAAGLVTRQPVTRIVSYYQKDMIANGAITLEKDTTVAA